MGTRKVAIPMDEEISAKLDLPVKRRLFPNRSMAIQAAVQEKLWLGEKGSLVREGAKLDIQ